VLKNAKIGTRYRYIIIIIFIFIVKTYFCGSGTGAVIRIYGSEEPEPKEICTASQPCLKEETTKMSNIRKRFEKEKNIIFLRHILTHSSDAEQEFISDHGPEISHPGSRAKRHRTPDSQ
jgi:hypothetical protein